jgi:hypothetical protein
VFARIHTLETTPEQYEYGLRLIVEDVLPWARESSGFRGAIGLVDKAREQSVFMTFWEDEESLDKSFEAADRLGLLAAAASGATRRSLESFEVTLFELTE